MENKKSNSKGYLMSWKDSHLSFENLSNILIKSYSVGNTHICYENDYSSSMTCKGHNYYGEAELQISNIISYSAGFNHTCAIYTVVPFRINKIECYGNNDHGQLIKDHVKLNIDTIKGGKNFTCFIYLKKNNVKRLYQSLKCIGNNIYGIEDVPEIFVNSSFESENKLSIVISIGYETTCALALKYIYNNGFACWGQCSHDMCTIPSEVQQMNISQTSVGHSHICSLVILDSQLNNRVSCWGDDYHGQSRIPPEYNITNQSLVEQVAAGLYSTCLLMNNMKLYCWGKDTQVHPTYLNYTRIISAGGRHTCAHMGGDLKCWGSQEFGVTDVPTNMAKDSYILQSSFDWTCAANTTSQFKCWGVNFRGQLDFNSDEFQYDIKGMSLGVFHGCIRGNDINRFEGIETDTKLICWGDEEYATIPTDFKEDNNISLVAAGDNHTCVYIHDKRDLTNNYNKVKCWGNNDYGQLDVKVDQNYDDNHPRGTQVYSIMDMGDDSQRSLRNKNVKTKNINFLSVFQDSELDQDKLGIFQLSAGGDTTCANSIIIMTCWGSDSHGQATIPINYSHRILQVSVGVAHTCVLMYMEDNISYSISCWGIIKMELHDGGKYSFVSSGFQHVCSIDKYGKPNCYGSDDDGQTIIPFEELIIKS